jgi:hypothetical protein
MLVGHAQMLVVAAGHAAVPSPSLALPSAPVLVLVLVLDDSIIGDANGAVGQERFWAMAMAMAPPPPAPFRFPSPSTSCKNWNLGARPFVKGWFLVELQLKVTFQSTAGWNAGV